MKILVVTPTYDGTVVTEYVAAILRLYSKVATRDDIDMRGPLFIESLVVNRARNAAASIVLQDPSLTHLLFVDADMGFRPEAVIRLIDSGKAFCGCIYPGRRPDPKLAHAAFRATDDPELARSAGQIFVATEELAFQNIDGRPGLRVQDGFARTTALGMGLTLIKREVFETLRAHHPELLTKSRADYLNRGVHEEVLQCFEPLRQADGMFLGEDKSFARRWTATGGEIWACVDETLTHSGKATASGSFVDRLKLGLGSAPVV